MLTKGTTMRWMRKIVIAVSAVVAVVGSFIGSGAAGGTPIAEAADGALSASSTAIAPGGPAFGIWSVIYVGLIAFAVWQFLPRTADRARHDRLAVPATLSLLLNAAWILSVQFGYLWLSESIIVALLGVLAWAFVVLRRTRPSGRLEAVITDGTFGLYLGWVCVATAANTAAVLTAAGFRGFSLGQDVWGVVVAAVAGLVGVLVAVTGRGRISPTLSLGWGLAWVAVARLDGPLVSVPTAVTAVGATVVVVVVTLVARARAGWAARPAALRAA
ncbi:tryptophan-rich sensory protein [Curtobacterium sp. PsM8]|nr:tryptophan-rich sensory protein [Curtobacterium sp. PsM8]